MHDRPDHGEHACLRRGADAKFAVRSGQGLHAGVDDRHVAVRACGVSGPCRAQRRRTDCTREGEAACPEQCVVRSRRVSRYLAAVLFSARAGFEFNQVPYRSTAQAMLDLVEGRVEVQFGTVPPTLPLIRDGKMRTLAVTGARRSPSLPDVPTIAEAGLAGYEGDAVAGDRCARPERRLRSSTQSMARWPRSLPNRRQSPPWRSKVSKPSRVRRTRSPTQSVRTSKSGATWSQGGNQAE